MFFQKFLAILTTLSLAIPAVGQTLPQGIFSPSFRWARIEGMGQVFNSAGGLQNVSDARAITLDKPTLQNIPEANRLIQFLDAAGGYGLGSMINMGTFKVHAQPVVEYFAPVLGYGVTDRWTVGVGVPILKFTNTVHLTLENSNLDVYRQIFGNGSVGPAVDEGLNRNIIQEVQHMLRQNGYDTLGSRSQTFLGDVQLASIYQLHKNRDLQVLHQLNVILPTGPKDNPDDLLALNSTGRFSIDNTLSFTRTLAPRWDWLPSATLQMPLPDRLEVRDTSQGAVISPDKVSVTRWLGPAASVISDVRWSFAPRWALQSGVELYSKARGQYWGAEIPASALDPIADARAINGRAQITYDTVSSYLAKKAPLPTILSLSHTSMFAGANTYRQSKTELNVLLFF